MEISSDSLSIICYSTQGYFCFMYFSPFNTCKLLPFNTCKWFCHVLYQPRHGCVLLKYNNKKNSPSLKFALFTMRTKGVKIIWGQIFSCLHTVYPCISSHRIYISIHAISLSLWLRMTSRVEQRRHSTSGSLWVELGTVLIRRRGSTKPSNNAR